MARVWVPVGIRHLTCTRCGNGFEAKRSDAKLCLVCRDQAKYDRYEAKVQRVCSDCGKIVSRRGGRCKACAIKAGSYVFSGERNPYWKGGRIRDDNGYIRVKNPDGAKPRYIGEHILVWQAANGPVPNGWHIHHINGIRDDNRLENLQAMSRHLHQGLHVGTHFKERILQLEARIRELEARIRELESPM